MREHADIAAQLKNELVEWTTELSPPGLPGGNAGMAAEQFFDFYLDGKPAPKRLESPPKPEFQVAGVLARNATLQHDSPLLTVIPENKNKPPFVVLNHLKLPKVFELRVQLRNKNGGQVKIAWRREGESDFNDASLVAKDVSATMRFQEVKMPVKTSAQVIHIRIILPQGVTGLKRIEAFDPEGNLLIRRQF